MGKDQFDLFPDETVGKDMEQKADDSAGLSIIPYLAVSKHEGGSVQNQKNVYQSRKGLSKEQKGILDNLDYYLRQDICKDFENRNGYPFEWFRFSLTDTLFRERGEATYQVEKSPFSTIVRKKEYYPPYGKHYGRDCITNYSMKSRRRFFEALLTMDWNRIPTDTIRELTLTYPAIYPDDGLILKAQLNAFAKRLKRFGKDYGQIAFAWKLEFQRRGAPHYHLIVISGSPIPLDIFRTWALVAWSDLVKKWIESLDSHTDEEKQDAIEKHRQAGIEADKVKKAKAGLVCYVAWYIGKNQGKAKEYQHEVPDRYKNVGRWWGFYGKGTGLLRFHKEIEVITEEEYERLRQEIQDKWEKDGRRYKVRPAKISLYSFDNEPDRQDNEEMEMEK
jgi:hypothetical protein